MGLVCTLFGHQWNHCKCIRCGEIRKPARGEPDPHDWNGCVCRVCGQKRDEGHRYKNGVCGICGRRITKEEIRKAFMPGVWKYPREAIEKYNPKDLIRTAYEILPEAEADEILGLAYVRIAFSVQSGLDEVLKEHIVPFINERSLRAIYTRGSRFDCLARVLDRDLVIRSCHKAGWNREKKIMFLKECKIADHDLITPCDIGDHDLECIGSRWSEKTGTSDTVDVSHEYLIYRCKRCGFETERASGRTSL